MEGDVAETPGSDVERIEHSHGNGEWHEMHEVPGHDSAQADPERGWLRGRLFRCSTCADEIRIGGGPSAPIGDSLRMPR